MTGEELTKCANCRYYIDGKCYQTSQHEDRKIDAECDNDLFDPLDIKKELKQCYDEIDSIIDYYMDIPKEQKNIIVLWIIGTYFHKNFQAYPYLFINAMRGSGKTRLLKIISNIAKDGQLLTSLTEATMFRTTGMLAIDEFEGLNKKENTALRELLNSAYKKGSKVLRMKKKKGLDGEEQVVQEFEPYRPIVMANIWGMEEVLGDRCISVVIEKSIDSSKTKLVENFSLDSTLVFLKKRLEKSSWCSLCSVVTPENMYICWNSYVKGHYNIITTPIYIHTLTTLNNTNYTELFDKIMKTGIDGRYLELFFPLFLIAGDIDEKILTDTLGFAETIVNDKKIDEITESKDVIVYSIVAQEPENEWRCIKKLTQVMKLIVGEEFDWLNPKWMGRALKRLGLIKSKRRMGDGIHVLLDVAKAKEKSKMFGPKDVSVNNSKIELK